MQGNIYYKVLVAVIEYPLGRSGYLGVLITARAEDHRWIGTE